MRNLGIYLVIVAFSIFFLIFCLNFFSYRGFQFTRSKPFIYLEKFLIVTLLTLIPVIIIVVTIEGFLEPSEFEKCMSRIGNTIDKDALTWQEEYCSTTLHP